MYTTITTMTRRVTYYNICRLGFLKKNFYLSATLPLVDVIV